jgi:hypothetical protein
MDSLTIDLFLEDNSSKFLRSGWNYWNLFHPDNSPTTQGIVNWVEMGSPSPNNYWSGDSQKLERFADDFVTYANSRNYIFTQTLNLRSNLLKIADNIHLFGNSVMTVIAGTSAGTYTQNLTQADIDALDSSLLSIEDCACVQSFSSHMDALLQTTSSALNDVSTFQNKISELKLLITNNLQPTTMGVLALFAPTKFVLDKASSAIEVAKKNGSPAILEHYFTKMYEDLRKAQASFYYPHAPMELEAISYLSFLNEMIDLSESISIVQPSLSKFEILWIETHSFILNSKQNAEAIQDVKMLKVFRTRMQKIMNDWSNVKTLLGAQSIPLQ